MCQFPVLRGAWKIWKICPLSLHLYNVLKMFILIFFLINKDFLLKILIFTSPLVHGDKRESCPYFTKQRMKGRKRDRGSFRKGVKRGVDKGRKVRGQGVKSEGTRGENWGDKDWKVRGQGVKSEGTRGEKRGDKGWKYKKDVGTSPKK